MKRKMLHKDIKWYHPFQLIKRNYELERLVNQLFLIINDYSDELKLKEKQLKSKNKLIEKLKKEK